MLRGDLEITPLPDLLKRLADAKATGCVYLLPTGRHSSKDEAVVALRDGAICNLTLSGAQDAVGTRLVASRRLSPASLAEAREAQETELASWMLSELLIHLGLADEREVHELVNERGLSDLTELCGWSSGSWRFRRRERWGPSLPQPLNVEQALVTVAERRQEWLRLLPAIRGADAVVSLAVDPDGHGGADESGSVVAVEMDGDRFALLCAVDGVRTLDELGSSAGFTLLEAGRTFAKLARAGLVQLTLDSEGDESPPDGPDSADATNDDRVSLNEESESGSRSLDAIAAALSFDPDDSLMPADLERGIAPVGAPWQPPRTSRGDPLADALARVSAALSEAMSEPRHQAEHVEIAVVATPVAHVTGEQVEDLTAVPRPARSEPEIQVDEQDLPDVQDEVEQQDLPDLQDEVEQQDLPDDDNEIQVPEPDVNYESHEARDADQLAAFAALSEMAETVDPGAPGAAVRDQVEVEVEVAVPDVDVDVDVDVQPQPELAPAWQIESQSPPAAGRRAEVVPPTRYETQPPTRSPHAADAARLLSQLAEEPLTRPAAPAPTPSQPPPAAPADFPPRPRRENGLVDTAALLRELSSLGTEDDRADRRPVPNRVSAPNTQGGQHARKRKGLFGRG